MRNTKEISTPRPRPCENGATYDAYAALDLLEKGVPLAQVRDLLGQPHFIASPEALVEDFSAAVDYLGTNALVDRARIGVIGICGSGGFSLAAAQIDPSRNL